MGTGGKCLRGRLVLGESEHLNISTAKSMKWALACELLHNATLIHDDIQDNDPIRRGQPSLWKKAGIAQAINTGDYLIFRAFKLTAELEDFRLTKLLSEVSEQLVHGQSDELSFLVKNSHSFCESYKKMAIDKTGSLFLLPIEGTYLLANKEMPIELKKAWLNLGLCYQIIDDIRDYQGLKQQGQMQKDFEERRINALVAYLSENSKYETIIDKYLSDNSNSESVMPIISAIEEENIIPKLEQITKELLNDFRTQSSLQCQEIIFSFIDQATKKRK